MNNKYDIHEHQHRFAAWAASRASFRGLELNGLGERAGGIFLEGIGFDASFALGKLPAAEQIDATHLQWRKGAIAKAETEGVELTHGRAAKLINIYLKCRFVCGGFESDPRVAALHPPIDSQLLKGLAKDDPVKNRRRIWRRFDSNRWSKFDSEIYQSVIDLVRETIPGRPLWEIEKYWPGHQ